MAEKNSASSPIGETFQIKEGKPLKNVLNRKTLHEGAIVIKSVYNSFKVDEFVNSILDKNWDNLELKARGRQVTLNLGKYLPTNYRGALSILEKITMNYTSGLFVLGFSFPDFVEVYGQDKDNWDLLLLEISDHEVYNISDTVYNDIAFEYDMNISNEK
ncbi:MAG: hypothetical protein LBE76_08215, partial [Nitrososphaerota archaeon]|nr:hypothetical protein [Nitrososphaerota archaeon]